MSSIGAIGSDPSVQPWGVQAKPRHEQKQQDLDAALRAVGVDPSKVPNLRSQIDAAVQAALKSGSGTPGQDRQAVAAAVDSVLKQNGIDPQKFRTEMKSLEKSEHSHKGHRHHRAGKADPNAGLSQQPTPKPAELVAPGIAPDSAPPSPAAGIVAPDTGGIIDANA
jgi:hypothetical protein